MKTASDIANFFIDLAIKVPEIELMTNLKLNKLLYFAQGEYLANFEEPLFDEDFQAWRLGPVIKSIYDEYKACGRQPITYIDDTFNIKDFSDEESNFLTDILVKYGFYSAQGLVKLSHKKGGPWATSYSEGENSIIAKNKIAEYFKNNPETPIKDTIEVITMLPANWYNAEDDEHAKEYL